jgi:hypothetical protein
VTRIVDRGALTAGWVGVGMAVTVAISFLMVIPIEPIYWLIALPSGLLIGYYADARAGRVDGPWSRILVNALWAGLVTGLTYALLLVAVKGLFFVADDGYRDASAGGRIECGQGADCVYQRYLLDGRGPDLTAAGVTDVDSFARFYWEEQLKTAGLLIVLTTVGGLGGGLIYGLGRPRSSVPEPIGTPGAERGPHAPPLDGEGRSA